MTFPAAFAVGISPSVTWTALVPCWLLAELTAHRHCRLLLSEVELLLRRGRPLRCSQQIVPRQALAVTAGIGSLVEWAKRRCRCQHCHQRQLSVWMRIQQEQHSWMQMWMWVVVVPVVLVAPSQLCPNDCGILLLWNRQRSEYPALVWKVSCTTMDRDRLPGCARGPGVRRRPWRPDR